MDTIKIPRIRCSGYYDSLDVREWILRLLDVREWISDHVTRSQCKPFNGLIVNMRLDTVD